MFLMSGVIDTPMTRWETMFLPVELEAALDETTVVDKNGNRVPFVSEKTVWFESVGRSTVPDKAVSSIPLSLAVGIGVGVLFAAVSILLIRRKSGFLVHFGVSSMLIGIIYGIPGALLAFMALFTNHNVTYWNESLFFANPFTFLAIPLGIACVTGAKWGRWILAWLWIGLTGLLLLSLLLKLIPVFDQQNWNIVCLFLPIYLSLAYSGFTGVIKPENNRQI